MMPTLPIAHAAVPSYLEVGGARLSIRSLALRFDATGEISAMEVCLDSPPELQRSSLEAALRFGATARVVIRRGVAEITCVGYQLTDSSTDRGLVCYTLAGGGYAFDGVQLRQG